MARCYSWAIGPQAHEAPTAPDGSHNGPHNGPIAVAIVVVVVVVVVIVVVAVSALKHPSNVFDHIDFNFSSVSCPKRDPRHSPPLARFRVERPQIYIRSSIFSWKILVEFILR